MRGKIRQDEAFVAQQVAGKRSSGNIGLPDTCLGSRGLHPAGFLLPAAHVRPAAPVHPGDPKEGDDLAGFSNPCHERWAPGFSHWINLGVRACFLPVVSIRKCRAFLPATNVHSPPERLSARACRAAAHEVGQNLSRGSSVHESVPRVPAIGTDSWLDSPPRIKSVPARRNRVRRSSPEGHKRTKSDPGARSRIVVDARPRLSGSWCFSMAKPAFAADRVAMPTALGETRKEIPVDKPGNPLRFLADSVHGNRPATTRWCLSLSGWVSQRHRPSFMCTFR